MHALKLLSFLLLIFFLCISTVKAQDNPWPAESKPKRTIITGIYFSPDVSDLQLSDRNSAGINQYFIDKSDIYEGAKVGYTLGYTVSIDAISNWRFETGIEYSNMGNQTSKTQITLGDLADNRSGFNFSPNSAAIPDQARFRYNYHYLGIPIRMRYTGSVGSMSHFTMSLGITASYLSRSTVTTILYYQDSRPDRSSQQALQDYNSLNLIPSVSLGLTQSMGRGMHVQFEPTLRVGAMSIVDSPIKAHLFSAGLQIGFYKEL